MVDQQIFLREAAKSLGVTQQELAVRMAAPWTTFKKWLAPSGSNNFREMPDIARQLVQEIQKNQNLLQELGALRIQGAGAPANKT